MGVRERQPHCKVHAIGPQQQKNLISLQDYLIYYQLILITWNYIMNNKEDDESRFLCTGSCCVEGKKPSFLWQIYLLAPLLCFIHVLLVSFPFPTICSQWFLFFLISFLVCPTFITVSCSFVCPNSLCPPGAFSGSLQFPSRVFSICQTPNHFLFLPIFEGGPT